MNEQEELIEILKRTSVLLKKFEDSAITINNQSVQSTQNLDKSINSLENKQTQFLKDSNATIEQGVIKGMVEGFSALEKQINGLCDNVNRSTNQIYTASSAVTKQTKVTGWTTFIGVVCACLAIAGFTAWYSWSTQQKTDALAEYYKRIEYGIEIKDLINNSGLTSCDGELCYKSEKDQSIERYSKNEDYIIIKNK